MTIDTITLPFICVLNGLLTITYLLFEHFLAVLLLGPLVWLSISTEKSRRPWMIGASALALGCSIFAPAVIGIWLNVMAIGSIVALRLEKFNPALLRWRIAGGLAAYGLVGIGFLAYTSLSPMLADSGGIFSQGQGYLDVIISIAVYVFPLGFIGILVQSIWAHPPVDGGTPEQIIYRVRTRGQE